MPIRSLGFTVEGEGNEVDAAVVDEFIYNRNFKVIFINGT